MWHVIEHALLDTLKIFPFLFLIYVLIELLENKTSFTKNQKVLQGPLAPLIGTATGLIPQCGFSVMAARLYERSLIRTGTLLAVFIATSDEALIILLSDIKSAPAVMPLVLIKFLVAIGVGYLFNFLFSNEQLAILEEHHHEIHAYSCGREHEGKSNLKVFLIDPLLHSLKIAGYLLIINLVFGFIIEAVGEEKISSIMIGGPYFQPFITSLIGLIPNCASSVLITGTFIKGGITFGSMVAGLCANAGLGFMILIRNPKKIKRNVLLVVALYVISTAVGVVVNAGMVLFNLI